MDSYIKFVIYLAVCCCSTEAQLILTVSPAIVTEHDPQTFICKYSGSLVITSLGWRKDLQPAFARFSVQNGKCTDFKVPDATLYTHNCSVSTNTYMLTIQNVMRQNTTSTWQCNIFLEGGATDLPSNRVSPNINVPITSVSMTNPEMDNVIVPEETEAVFTCVTSGGLPKPSVQWYNDSMTPGNTDDDVLMTSSVISTNKTHSDGLIETTSTLTYKPSRFDNGMRVYCQANIEGQSPLTSSTKRLLNVQYSPDGPPTIEEDKYGKSYNIIENSRSSLSCSIKGGNPLATLTWNCYNTGSASVIVGTTVTKTVTWTAVRDKDRSCTCQSSHTVAGTQSVSIDVQVLYPPDSPNFKVNGKGVSGPVSFIEGNTRSIVCESSGKPKPDTYTWRKDGTAIRSDNTLIFSDVQKQNDGQYTCSAQNTMVQSDGTWQTGTNSSAVTLTVLFSPTTPSLHYGGINGQSITTNSNDVVRGDTFTIACKSEGQPEPTYRWSGQTTDNQTLSITSINDNLSRSCTSSNTMRETNGETQQGSATTKLTLNVLYAPSITDCKLSYSTGSPVQFTTSIDVIEGSSLTLTCTANSKPAATFTWSGPVTSTSATLTLNNISKQQNGTYQVTAENIMDRTFGESETGRDRNRFDLNILYAPKVAEMNTKDVIAGSQLSFSCPFEKGNPPAVIFKWTWNGDKVWNHQLLVIDNITKHDDMIYTCAVRNTMNPTGALQQYGEDSGSFHLNVLYKASVTSFIVKESEGSASVTVSENDKVPFVCTVDSNPESSIEIQFQGETLHRQDNIKTLTYSHSNAACLDTGVYTCTATNKYNNGKVSQRKLTVYVKCSPRPLGYVKENVTSALRVSAILSFTGLAYPIPEASGFTWQKKEGTKWIKLSNSSDVLISISEVNSNLTVSNVTQSDYGKYQLIVQNEVKNYTQAFQLVPEGVPESPTEFKALEKYTKKTSVLLQWKPGFSGGPEQIFILMYKSTTEQLWKNITVEDSGDVTMNYTLGQLDSGTKYQAFIFARNRIGDSSRSKNETFSTTEEAESPGNSGLIGAVAGGISGLVLFILVAAVVFLFRRGVFTKGKAHSRDDKNDRKPVYEDENDYGMQENPMYVSAGPRNQEGSAGGSGQGAAGAIYSTVDKKKNIASGNSDVYAEVDKSKKAKTNKGKKDKKEKSKQGILKDKINKKGMQEGDLYANATAANTQAKEKKSDETIYENPEPFKPVVKKNVNKDGLIYADLTFNDQPKGQKKLVIHGLDSMTEYVQVDFTKKADPLPDSDEESNSPTK